jgi:lipoate-protein ligase B
LSGRKVTYHGFALNGTTDLSAYELIVPCGIEGRTAASLVQCGASGDCQPEALGELVAPFVAHALGLRLEEGTTADLADLGIELTTTPARA